MKIIVLILFFSLFVTCTIAQVVGGVGGAELWVRTIPADRDSLQYKWLDLSGDSVMLVSGGKSNADNTSEFTQSKKSIRTINFHPALNMAEGGLAKVLKLNAMGL